MLIGREAERALLDALIDDARRGLSRVLVLSGDAGIGKTALLAYARERAKGMRTLGVAGVEPEADLAYGALHALLRPVLDLVDRIPETQARALNAALALDPAEQRDPLAAYAATLSLLAEAAAGRPLLVLVDDAHWIDASSGAALTFTARRIAGEDIAIVFAVRTGEPTSFDFAGLPEHRLGPLDRAASLTLLRERHGEALDAEVARAIAAASAGNPLALVEIPAAMTPDQLAGRALLDDPLPVAGGVERAFLHRVQSLDDATRRSLLVAAAGAGAPIAAIREAAGAVGGGALAPAEADGLVALDGRSISFRHPLLRAVVYHAAPAPERRAAHRALAAALAADGDADRRAWHLAAAAEGPDEEAAGALEAAAERALARGGYAAQSRALERAAELSGDEDARARRLHAAARAAYWAGHVHRAVRLAREALTLARDPLVRADIRHHLAVIADFHADLRRDAPTTDELEREAATVEPRDPERAIALLGVVLQRRRMRLEAEAAVDVAERRLALAERVGGERLVRSQQDLAQALCLAGRLQDAAALQDAVLAARAGAERLPVFASQAAEPLVWLERHDELRGLLGKSIERSRADGNMLRLAFDLTNLATLELRVGRLDAAAAAGAEALLLAQQIAMDYLEACNHATLAAIAARRGNAQACRDHAERARAAAGELEDELMLAEARMALASHALAEGRAGDVVDELEPVARLARQNLVETPTVLPYAADLIEAYVRTGLVEEAREEVTLLAARAARTGLRSARETVARCEGLLADEDAVDECFGRALAEEPVSVYERARTRLAYGERLRRANRRRDARPHLRAALEAFETVGAAPWAERARAELLATGETAPRRDRPSGAQLTPQELQIALLVAEGRTNREIASSMFLSPKTVEFHLTRIYRKLDLNSRGELIRLFARQGEPAPTVPA